MTLEQKLAEISERAEAATSGPWEYDEGGDIIWGQQRRTNNFPTRLAHVADIRGFGNGLPMASNGKFIAHAKQDIPLLVEIVREMQKELERIAKNNTDDCEIYTMGCECHQYAQSALVKIEEMVK